MIASLAVVGCGGDANQPADDAANSDVIKIGVYEPLTGVNAAGGEMTLEGIT